MSVKELKDAAQEGKVFFGIRQAIRQGKNGGSVFICRDSRDLTIEKLEKEGIEFVVLKNKDIIAKELNLDFECEVFCIK